MLHSDADGTDAASSWIPAIKWIAYETRIDETLCFFHDGRWFAVEGKYSEHIRAETTRVLARKHQLPLIRWKEDWKEDDYNKKLGGNGTGFLLLDKKRITTQLHTHGIEACDLLGPGDELVHVKYLNKSSDASHLFSQALVSAESLLLDGEAREKFAAKVTKFSEGTRTAPELPRTVVVAIAGRGQLSTDSLFTFSQVTLIRLVHNLEARGVDVVVASIPT